MRENDVVDKEQRSMSARARSQVVIKIVATVVIGTITFLITSAIDLSTASQVILSIGVSVFVSGIAFLTSFLIDVDKNLDGLGVEVAALRHEYRDHAEAAEQLIQQSFARISHEFTKINDARKLFGLVEASDLKTDAMTELVVNATTIGRGDPPLIFDFAQREIARLSGYLRNLGLHGDVTYDGEDRDWLLGLTKVATRSIEATSLTTVDAGGHGYVEGGLWDNDLGRRYLEAQREAVARGVRIRRILIIDRQDLNQHNDLAQLIAEHQRIGVQVRILNPRQIQIRRTSIADFIVMDRVLVYQSTPTPRLDEGSNPVIEHTRLVTNPDHVHDRVSRWEELWAASSEFHPDDDLLYAVPRPRDGDHSASDEPTEA
jgi:hypothetical protein